MAVALAIAPRTHKNDPILDMEPGCKIPTELSGPFAVLVTPALAEYFLTLNEVNRKIKTKWVAMARDMLASRWAYPSSSLVFDDTGKLKNGQNRLTAVIAARGMDGEAFRPVWMRVEFGWDNGSLDVLDTGSPRSAADALRLHGIGNQNVVASTISLVHKFEATVGTSRRWSAPAQGNFQASPSEILAAYEDDEQALRKAISAGTKVNRNLDRSLSAATWSAAYYVCAARSPELADLFFAQVSGTSDTRSVAAQSLRDYEMRRRIKDGVTEPRDEREHIENIVRAFKAHTKAEKPGFVRVGGFVLTKPPVHF